MNKRILILLTVTVLVLSSVLPAALTRGQSSTVQCVPYNSPVIVDEDVRIDVLNGEFLWAKFIYAKPSATTNYANNSMPVMIMTHGIGGTIKDIESAAMSYAERCFLVLAVNHRGQGPEQLIESQFHFYGSPERNDLAAIITKAIAGPPSAGDLAMDNYVAMRGDSQGSLTVWIAVADANLRGRIRAAVPQNSAGMMSQVLLPQTCISANAAALFDPDMVRTPYATVPSGQPTNTPDVKGILWEPTTYAQFAAAYLTSTPNIPFWQTAVATRDPGDELATPVLGAGGAVTPHPYLWTQAGQQDVWQWTDETAAGWQTVTPPPTLTPAYPASHLELGRGGHVDENLPWEQTNQEKLDNNRAQADWLQSYLGPFYNDPNSLLTPVSTFTPGPNPTTAPTPLFTPAAVNFLVDSFDANNASKTPMPTFERKEAPAWPPTTPTVVARLYLHATTVSNLTPMVDQNTPLANDGYAVIGQDYSAGVPPYNMGTAVAESPAFAGFVHPDHLSTLSMTYVSPPLAQDVILIGPPQIKLYAEPDTIDGYPIQVHIRIREQLAAPVGNPVSHFITRANACDWTEVADVTWFQGTLYYGETRVHKFKAGNKIEIEVASVDREEYYPAHSALSITPHLGGMRVRVYHRQGQATNVSLPLLPSNPGGDLFQTGGGLGGPSSPEPERQPEPTATPAPPAPLTIAAQLLTGFTNPGGWYNYAPRVLIECSGGVAPVDCPQDTVLDSDGINQSFTFTATDSVGTVVTTTLPAMTIDNTAPVLTTTLPESQTFCSGSTTQLDFAVSDALSGLFESTTTFNGAPAEDNNVVELLAGANTLSVNARDVAGNRLVADEVLQANYNLTKNFPADGQNVNPLLPLAFAFQVRDACTAQGWYAGATGTLWLTGPDGEEIPAEWFGLPGGNTFTYNALTGWYAFDADLSGLAAGTWSARAHLNDGTDHTVTFVISGEQLGSDGDAAGQPVAPRCDASTALGLPLVERRQCR